MCVRSCVRVGMCVCLCGNGVYWVSKFPTFLVSFSGVGVVVELGVPWPLSVRPPAGY